MRWVACGTLISVWLFVSAAIAWGITQTPKPPRHHPAFCYNEDIAQSMLCGSIPGKQWEA